MNIFGCLFLDEDIVNSGLSEQDKSYLLKLARRAIFTKCQNTPFELDVPQSKTLNEKRGAFVTLNKFNQLRGCIGYLEANKPLYQIIAEMAEAAAFSDPRFPQIKVDEVDDLKIEISVLSQLERIQNIENIKIGSHGLLIKKQVHQGLLLPQVASHYGWDRNTFLDQTCLKAGIPEGSWKNSEVEVYIFSAQIFSEFD